MCASSTIHRLYVSIVQDSAGCTWIALGHNSLTHSPCRQRRCAGMPYPLALPAAPQHLYAALQLLLGRRALTLDSNAKVDNLRKRLRGKHGVAARALCAQPQGSTQACCAVVTAAARGAAETSGCTSRCMPVIACPMITGWKLELCAPTALPHLLCCACRAAGLPSIGPLLADDVLAPCLLLSAPQVG